MFKVPKQVYTAEFKLAIVQRVKDGQGVAVVARELGVSEQTLRNWVKAEASGKLNGAGAKPVTPEQMELSRLRAENKRLQMELEIAKKAAVGSMDGCNTFLLISNEGGLTNGTNGKAGVVARRQVRGLAAV
ncbi:transposase, partial [Burkholderia gladioli]|uniref:transposase n=1 Tax=Burkholderia gladioli TaxID=28095 RepID=UPI001FC871FD